MQRRVHVWVSGRVQNVGFRASCFAVAHAAGVTGWVRNLADGRVEAVFEGSPDVVGRLVAWCRSGPAGAEVTAVEEREEEPTGEPRFLPR